MFFLAMWCIYPSVLCTLAFALDTLAIFLLFCMRFAHVRVVLQGLGGEEDKALRKGSAKTEPAWKFHEKYASGAFLKETGALKDSKSQPHFVEVRMSAPLCTCG